MGVCPCQQPFQRVGIMCDHRPNCKFSWHGRWHWHWTKKWAAQHPPCICCKQQRPQGQDQEWELAAPTVVLSSLIHVSSKTSSKAHGHASLQRNHGSMCCGEPLLLWLPRLICCTCRARLVRWKIRHRVQHVCCLLSCGVPRAHNMIQQIHQQRHALCIRKCSGSVSVGNRIFTSTVAPLEQPWNQSFRAKSGKVWKTFTTEICLAAVSTESNHHHHCWPKLHCEPTDHCSSIRTPCTKSARWSSWWRWLPA